MSATNTKRVDAIQTRNGKRYRNQTQNLKRNFVMGEFLNYAHDAEKESREMFSMLNSTFCAKMSVIGENYLYQVSDGVEEIRSMFNPSGKLLDCSVIVSQMEVKSFMHVCRLGLKNQKTEQDLELRFAHIEEAKLICQEFIRKTGLTQRMVPTVKELGDESSNAVSKDKTLKRSKRGFTYPGTLWCGAGNMADHYDHLGEFAETDSCCRVHDHCPYVIHALSSKYGYTNFKWHSICHCDCDNALKDCLRKVNDTASRVVGQAFFNVIEVPCFEFVYEDQCVERHWYGLCKRYEKLPVALPRESIPYDFGGIDVIDVLTVAPPKEKDPKEGSEQERPESTTKSTVSGSPTSGPEGPLLGNVVTAAEDFIKVLATVSTSQSSASDTAKGEMQTSEKKKKKNTGKKKMKKKNPDKHKGRGKGKRTRKQKVDTGSKVEEGAAVSLSGNKAEEVVDKSNFISEARKTDQSSRNTNNFIDSKFDLGEKEEPSNEVMKDEPAMDKESADVPVTSLTTVRKEQVAQNSKELKVKTDATRLPTSTSTTTLIPHKAKTQRSRKGQGRRKKVKITAAFPTTEGVSSAKTEKSSLNKRDDLSNISFPAVINITPAAQLKRQRLKVDIEKGPAVPAASTPIVIPKSKRNRSKERAEGKGRKKRRKLGTVGPIVAVARENSSVDNSKVIPSSGAPTVPSVPIAEPAGQQVSHRADIYGGGTSVRTTAITSTSNVLNTKRQRSKGRGQRRRRGKIAPPHSFESPVFQKSSEDVVPVLATPESIGLLDSPATTTVITEPTEETEYHGERDLLTTITGIPSVPTRRRRPTGREKRKPGRETASSDLKDRVTIANNNNETEHEPMEFTRIKVSTMPPKVDKTGEPNQQTSENTKQALYVTTTRTPFMSPIQLSIQRAKEQFGRKKRRKAALSVSQQ